MQKTGKRETAVALLVFLAALAVFDVMLGGETGALAWGELLAVPIIGFAFAAFGLHSLIGQAGWQPGARHMPGPAPHLPREDYPPPADMPMPADQGGLAR